MGVSTFKCKAAGTAPSTVIIRFIRVIRGFVKNPNFPRYIAPNFLQYLCEKAKRPKNMNPLIQLQQTTSVFLLAFGLACFGPSPGVHAVSPAPDGGYPGGNTAEGQKALFSLTTGGFNTAVGFLSLDANTTNNLNTAVGAGALLANTADNNTATGAGALLSNTTGTQNTANGTFALFSNTTGLNNNAFGFQSLASNATGFGNEAFGSGALSGNIDGVQNVSVGDSALLNNNHGNSNTAVGTMALLHNTAGEAHVAVGFDAGANQTTGAGNVYIGANMGGVGGESNQTYIRNINNTAVSGGGTDTVSVNLNTGLLGHLSSSRRYKEQIRPMNTASEALYRLKPVLYRYKKEVDPSQSLAFGLIAEEVAVVNPDLVACNAKGLPESVHYEMVNAMLLNEFLKEHKTVEEQGATIVRQEKQIEALSAGLQKVSAQLATAKPLAGAPETSKFATGRIRAVADLHRERRACPP